MGRQRPADLQPRRLRPRAVRDQVAVRLHPEPDQGLGDAHRQGRLLLRADHQQPAGQRQQQRLHGVRPTGPATTRATPSPTCSPARSRATTASRRRTRSTTSPGTAGSSSHRTRWKMSPSLTLDYGARLSVFEPWTDREGNGVAVFDQSRYASDLAAGVQFPGVSWNAQRPEHPRSGRRHAVLRPAPRRLRVGPARKRRDRAPRRRRHLHLPRRSAALRRAGRHRRGRAGATTRATAASRSSRSRASARAASCSTAAPSTSTTTSSPHLQLEPDRQPEAALVDEPRAGLRRQQERPPDEQRGLRTQRGSARRDAQRPRRQRQRLPSAVRIRRRSTCSATASYQNYHGLQLLLARQRGHFNFTLAYTFSKALGIRGDPQGPPWAPSTSSSPYRRLQLRRAQLRPYARGDGHLQLPAAGAEVRRGCMKAILGGWQFAGHPELRERLAAAVRGHGHELRDPGYELPRASTSATRATSAALPPRRRSRC